MFGKVRAVWRFGAYEHKLKALLRQAGVPPEQLPPEFIRSRVVLGISLAFSPGEILAFMPGEWPEHRPSSELIALLKVAVSECEAGRARRVILLNASEGMHPIAARSAALLDPSGALIADIIRTRDQRAVSSE